MAMNERSIPEVVRDVLRDMQDIVRLEFRLAKAEVVADVSQAKTPALLILGGTVAAIFATLFLLLAVASALVLVLPLWAANLSVGAALAVAAGLALTAGRSRLGPLAPPLERTMNSLKENVEWARQHNR